MNDALLADIRGGNKENISEACLMVEIIKGKSLVEYTGEDDMTFAKITVALPKFIPAAKRLLTTQIVYEPLQNHVFSIFEANVDIETRYFA